MHTFLLVAHILVAILLIVMILIQRGRGGGLVESFSGVESMFGTKTSVFLTRITAILASIFLFTSISLALIAARQSRSLIEGEATKEEVEAEGKQQVAEEGQSAESVLPQPQEGQEQTTQEENISD
jgi:preprotein translocase subunit SecG